MEESIEIIGRLAEKGIRIDIFFSEAGRQVCTMFGLMPVLKKAAAKFGISLYFSEDQRWSYPICGAISMGRYDIIVVSPATANTVAKITCKIADTLVTNIVSQALKGGIPVYTVPTDFSAGPVKTKTPIMIDGDICRKCPNSEGNCLLRGICPQEAISFKNGRPRVNLLKCIGCKKCVGVCPEGAVTFGKEITIKVHPTDAERTELLKKMEGIRVLREPQRIVDLIGSGAIIDGKR